jgi:hypothetical protein
MYPTFFLKHDKSHQFAVFLLDRMYQPSTQPLFVPGVINPDCVGVCVLRLNPYGEQVSGRESKLRRLAAVAAVAAVAAGWTGRPKLPAAAVSHCQHHSAEKRALVVLY